MLSIFPVGGKATAAVVKRVGRALARNVTVLRNAVLRNRFRCKLPWFKFPSLS
jgi:hypothetical protein